MNEYEGFSGPEDENEPDEAVFGYEIEENDDDGEGLSVVVAVQGEIVILALEIPGVSSILLTLPPLVAEELSDELKVAAEEAKKGWTVEAILKAGEDSENGG